jgi:hypothetical protein
VRNSPCQHSDEVLKDNHLKASQGARSERRGELVSSSKAQEVK